jgi:hypothetical protein
LAGVKRKAKFVMSMNKFMSGMKSMVHAGKQHFGLKMTKGKWLTLAILE